MPKVLSVESPLEKLTPSPGSTKPIFLNWPVDDPTIVSGDLLDSYDLDQYSLIFWDPLQFSYDHGFRVDDRDISVTQYVSFSQSELLNYFSKTKSVSGQLTRLLQRGGIIVIRSTIPRSFIKVKKSTKAGIRDYTESVIPAFSWIEDLIGKYSIHYFHTRSLKFLRNNSSLEDEFGSAPIVCMQSLTSIERGRIEVIASTGATSKSAAISRVMFEEYPGQIYFVPQFIISDEHRHLINAFGRIQTGDEMEMVLPSWLPHYETVLKEYSPYAQKIHQIEDEIQMLTQQKRVLENQQDNFTRFVNLLFESEAPLTQIVSEALTDIGFYRTAATSGHDKRTFKMVMEDQSYQRVIVRVSDTQDGPVSLDELYALKKSVESTKGRSKPKGILVSNASRTTPPERRQNWFDDECVTKCRNLNYCLLTTHELFYLVCLVESRRDSKLIDIIKSSLVEDILACNKQYTLDRKKYGA